LATKLFEEIGKDKCLLHLFKLSGKFHRLPRLAWGKNNMKPAIYNKIDKVMLPGDFIAMKTDWHCYHQCFRPLSEGRVSWDFP